MSDPVRNEFQFADKDFQRVQAMLYEMSGISLSDHKRDMVYGRLARRLRALGLASFSQYLDMVEKDHGGENESFINSLTTNLTSFFRENHHFEMLDEFIRERIGKGQKEFMIWSAGCSTGEEPYSIAYTLVKAGVDGSRVRAKLLATDLDTQVLQKAASALYSDERVRDLDPALVKICLM